MNSREKILAAVKKSQPALESLPLLEEINAIRFDNAQEKLKQVLEGIGGVLLTADSLREVAAYTKEKFPAGRLITTIDSLTEIDKINSQEDSHSFENVEAAVITGDFVVAENAAIWISAASLTARALPFITQHLVVVVPQKNILNNMHEAYEKIGGAQYGYGVFIAGPSKTADIEQSLVLGAHGSKSMTVFLLS
ncbi:MAG: LUD domain-containing protein [Chitinophagaceae bacterium]